MTSPFKQVAGCSAGLRSGFALSSSAQSSCIDVANEVGRFVGWMQAGSRHGIL
jgi:hypothetical protein